MELSKILTPARIRVPLQATDKIGAITELIDLLTSTGGLKSREGALETVLKREAIQSTGIGYGLAIPHGKSDACDRVVIAAGKPARPLDFQSVDGRPVTFVLLLVSPPDQTGAHIQALAAISRLMNIEQFRSAVDRAATAAQLYEAIAACESGQVSGKT